MKWNLINLDLVPSFDKFSAEEEGKGFFFFFFFLRRCVEPGPVPSCYTASLFQVKKGSSMYVF